MLSNCINLPFSLSNYVCKDIIILTLEHFSYKMFIRCLTDFDENNVCLVLYIILLRLTCCLSSASN